MPKNAAFDAFALQTASQITIAWRLNGISHRVSVKGDILNVAPATAAASSKPWIKYILYLNLMNIEYCRNMTAENEFDPARWPNFEY